MGRYDDVPVGYLIPETDHHTMFRHGRKHVVAVEPFDQLLGCANDRSRIRIVKFKLQPLFELLQVRLEKGDAFVVHEILPFRINGYRDGMLPGKGYDLIDE